MAMKILRVNADKGFCPYLDWLIGKAADEFIQGGYTHVDCGEEINHIEIVPNSDGDPMLLVGDAVDEKGEPI